MKSVLDSRQLLAARVLADTGSFTLAGQQLCLTQSAVSHAIKALEEEVECQLFYRTGKGVKVTAAGKHFLEYTDEILARMETARTLVTTRTTSGKERLRLGVSSRARELILPMVQPLFQREYPNRLVLIRPGDYYRNFDLLDAGLLDLSFTVRPEHRSDLAFEPLFEDELRFVVSASHPWGRSGKVSYEDVARDMLILFQNYNNTAELLSRHLQAERITPRHSVELDDHDSILTMVRTGRAVGVMSPFLVSEELQKGTLVSLAIGSRPLVRRWGLAHLGQRSLGPMDRRMIELCRQAVPGIMSRLQGMSVPPPESRGDRYEQAVSALIEQKLNLKQAVSAALRRKLDLGKVGLILASLHNLVTESLQRTDPLTLGVSVVAALLSFVPACVDLPKRG